MRSGLGWQSLDPMEAVAAVHSIDNRFRNGGFTIRPVMK